MSRYVFARGLALSAALLLAGCGDTPAGDCGPETGVECPSSDLVVAGVNLTDLFSPPSPGEVDAARASWTVESRAVGQGNVYDLGSDGTVTVLFESGGTGNESPIGAVREAPRESGDQRLRPILVMFVDGPLLTFPTAINAVPVRPSLRDAAVIVYAMPRGGAVRVGGETLGPLPTTSISYDPASTADALALIEHVRARAEVYGADPSRVAFIGYGRGGTRALLAAQQTTAEDYILSLAAPTSFFLPSVRTAAAAYLRGEVYEDFPGLTEVFDAPLAPLRDGTLTPEEARLALIIRSPALFTTPSAQSGPLAPLLVAHGERDTVVPIEHGSALDPLIRAAGGFVYLRLPEVTHEGILTDSQVLSTGAGFLCDELFPNVPNCF